MPAGELKIFNDLINIKVISVFNKRGHNYSLTKYRRFLEYFFSSCERISKYLRITKILLQENITVLQWLPWISCLLLILRHTIWTTCGFLCLQKLDNVLGHLVFTNIIINRLKLIVFNFSGKKHLNRDFNILCAMSKSEAEFSIPKMCIIYY